MGRRDANPTSEAALSVEDAALEDRVWETLRGIDDPCMCLAGKGLSIVDMGIVTRVRARSGKVEVALLFTDPSCLFELRVTTAMEERLAALPGIDGSTIEIECDKVWTTDRLSAKAEASFAADRARLLAGRSSSQG